MDITAIPHTPSEINEDISSILRAARAEILYPGQNPTPPIDITNALNSLADGVDLTTAIDEVEAAGALDQYFKKHANTLAKFHPSRLVRELAKRLVLATDEKV